MSARFKYPRTPHLPWSPGVTDDDVRCVSTDLFKDKHIVVTEKMDGENTTLYSDHCHARSVDSRHHPSRNWVKRLHASIAQDIPLGWRICGENLYARHSIAYENLKSYFYAFSIWNERNFCMSWSDTLQWFELLGLQAPNLLYRGLWNEALLTSIVVDEGSVEGYVVRLENEFHYENFKTSVAKWVRKGHVQTDTHWMHAEIIVNGQLMTNHSSLNSEEAANE